MAEHARREMLHVFRNDVVAAAEQRVGLRRMDQRDGRARACAETEQRRVSCGGADGGDVCAHLLGAVNRLDRLLHGDHILRRADRHDGFHRFLFAAVAVENVHFILQRGIAERNAHEEAVHLRFRQGIGADKIHRVLRRQHHKGPREGIGHAVHRPLPLFHLLIYPWIKKLVRVNKSFIVQRALTMRQMLESSARMSRYMHYTISEKNQSIWIAQREGRAKDSNDRTQDSVLKMLAMGGEGDLIDRLMEMNIAPLAISYEYDPCDFLKAQEFQLKRDIEGYKKTTQDDLINMQTGLFGYKGRVHFQVAPCLNDDLQGLDRSLPKPDLFARISACLDRRIHRNYRIYPGNYVAYDWLNGTTEFVSNYTEEEKQQFMNYIEQQLAKIKIPNKDEDFLREKLLLMYSNPLVNYLAACR